MKEELTQKIIEFIGEDRDLECDEGKDCNKPYIHERDSMYNEVLTILRSKAPELSQSIIDMVVEAEVEKIHKVFNYPCRCNNLNKLCEHDFALMHGIIDSLKQD